MPGKLVIISAPSGAGKTTICNHLLESGLNLEFSVSATTRQIRGKEKDGVNYFFLSPEEFSRKVSNDEFVEWEEVYKDLRYGTLKSELERIWSNGNNVLFDVDVQGGINLKKKFGEKALAIFIMPPSVEDLEKRLTERGNDSQSTINIRVSKAKHELTTSGMFDIIIVNDRLEDAKKEAYDIVKSFIGEESNVQK
jgi:guanylate kinase